MSKVASTSLVGRVIDGRYRVQSHLADGGMGTVFIAMDERLDREVALKVMRPDLARDDAFVARFRREARSAARLSHPHVVSVFDQGQDDSYVFLAMELVRGRTLRDVIRAEAPLTTRAALDIFEAILQALAAAHQAGLIHRDVKPENVLISEDGRIKVADFGLARAVTTDTLTTNSDVLLGTAAYLAPEQVEHGAVDQRSDVYSAGLLLFEMLTGEKAYPGDSPIHVAYQHVHGAVPMPSDAVPGIAPELDALIALGSAKAPEDRPADAGAMLVEVRRARGALGQDQLDGRPQPGANGSAATGSSTMALSGDSTSQLRRPPPPQQHRAGQVGPGGPTGGPPGGQPPGGPLQGPAKPPHSGPPAGARRAVATAPDERRTGWWIAAAVAVLLAVCGGGAAWWFTAGPGGTVTVPNVAGQGRGVAVRTIDDAGLSVQVREVFNESVGRNTVVRTIPGGGADQRKSDAVVVEVSKGPERFIVPQVVNVDQQAAQTRITQAHLKVAGVTEAFDETVPAGRVVSADPTVGSQLKKDAAVRLVVSKGRQPITVPVVTGKPQAEAESAVTGAGLKVTLAPQAFDDTIPAGSVISQTPANGTLFKGQEVTLVISKGPEMVTVPRVIDMNAKDARRTLEDAGLKVKVSRVFGGIFDTVRDQDPQPGTSTPKGTEVKISVV
ncbi:Stk1 family PASTA domain-containing Ser/Thr kinase [Luteipulveratus mongoliensis]|uniref:non-specific serine/threonine protein kinase n=1 Tax=Luteipulveratus mongoliensis TaxID=571913 RepID=A0A0K1JKM6_9MICO|nr:Stk1 family PASTA domain-containing Ser/Thr kinase [Luteipulveratus mongoliensis]AKU17135.1 hypothetical protein VV02_16855 [Luteipulveratus mongoliensis]